MSLENKFKEKLEDRRIEPTASAWDRIEGKLEVAQGKKKSKAVLWMAIAASFVAGVFLTAVLFNGGDSNATHVIVNTPNSQQASEENRYVPVKPSLEVPEVEVVDLMKKEGNPKKKRTPLQDQISKNDKQSTRKTTSNQIYKPQTRNTSEEIVQVQVEGPALGVNINVEEEKEAVASVEADELLKDAQRDIISEGLFNKNSNRVDANALLLDVEAEVDPDTFKDKIFKSLKTGFDKAVEAVASKNN